MRGLWDKTQTARTFMPLFSKCCRMHLPSYAVMQRYPWSALGTRADDRRSCNLLQPVQITAPISGHVVDSDRPGTPIHEGGLVAKLATPPSSQAVEVRSPIPGRIRSVPQTGANVVAGSEIAVIDPGTEQVWEALRALYLIGQVDDLPAIRPYERDVPDVSNDVRTQAVETEKAILKRAGGK